MNRGDLQHVTLARVIEQCVGRGFSRELETSPFDYKTVTELAATMTPLAGVGNMFTVVPHRLVFDLQDDLDQVLEDFRLHQRRAP